MMTSSPVQLNVRWIPNGHFFIWGVHPQNPRAYFEPFELKMNLFAWHEKSFYGTFVEQTSIERMEGLILSAATALDYFASPCWNTHFPATWSEEAKELFRAAPKLLEAVRSGGLVPDYEKWKQGEIGWKVPLEDSTAALPYVNDWLDHILSDRLSGLEMLRDAMDRFKRASLPDADTLPEELWEDEEDWLQSIGWREDPAPFRAGLRLTEPEFGTSWQLDAILQDKNDPELVILCSSSGEPLPEEAGIPSHWSDYLQTSGVSWTSLLQHHIRKWLILVPWMSSEESSDGSLMIRQTIHANEAWSFLSEYSLRLTRIGYSVMLPAWWERLKQAKPRIRARVKSSVGANAESLFGMDQVVRFDWKIAIDKDTELTEEEFREIAESQSRLVRVRDRWVTLDPEALERVQQVMKQIRRKNGLPLREVLELHFLGAADVNDSLEDPGASSASVFMEVELNEHMNRMLEQLNQASMIDPITVPSAFRGVLRRYQIEGVSWMLLLRRFGFGGCLADDMGLGKTIQWITYLLKVKEELHPQSPALLICPTSVIGNWQKELERFAPGLKVCLHYGPHRAKGEAFPNAVKDADLVITSYTLAHLDEEELSQLQWSSICLDEAQNIKNAYTKQSSSIRRLQAEHRIAMTGTPLENRLTELWAIYDFINPGYLGSLRSFTHRFVQPIERTKNRELIQQVRRFIQPFLLRRVKNDPAIELDLPEKLEYKTFVSLTVEQAALYEGIVSELFTKLESLSPMERRGLILSTLTRLKQICDHPALIQPDARVSASAAGRSQKQERLLEMVRELRQEGDRCIVFTQFVSMGNLLQAFLEKELGEQVLFLHGGTPKQKRDELIHSFQSDTVPDDERAGVFILSLKAGGVGLNLTAANHVFHYDRWWNPAVETQATDRAFRIGQTKRVQVHKFVTLGTLEERIDEMIESKLGLAREIVGSGESWITELSSSELKDLFRLRKEWIES
jgi:SNF2 family DNA or RNA helicase